MNIVGIIQARMSSTRLPKKVLRKIRDKAILWYVINRLKKSRLLTNILVATSNDKLDTPIEKFCKEYSTSCFRGSLENVLERYYRASLKTRADVIVRITADCPLIDASLVDRGIKRFITNSPDYLSNTILRTYPRGFDFEVFTFNTLKSAFKQAGTFYEKEHVTPYIWNHPKQFSIEKFTQSVDKSRYRITLDTQDDLLLVKKLIELYKADTLNCQQIISIMDTHPELSEINKHSKQQS